MDELLRAKCWNRAPLWAALLLLAGCDSLGTTKKFSNPVVPPPPRERLISKKADNEFGGRQKAAEGPSSTEVGGGPGHAALPSGEPSGRGRLAARNSSSSAADSAEERDEPDTDAGQPIVQVSGARDDEGWKPNAVPPAARESESPRRSTTADLTAFQSSTETEGAGKIVEKGEVAALVNGTPIFYEDVLLPFAHGLAQAERQMPPEEFRRQRNALAKKHLQPHIEQELLLHKLRTKIKEEQLTQIKKHIDSQFDEELRDTMKKMRVSTPGELEIQLRKSGSSIETLKTTFRNRHLAQQYLSTRAIPKTGFDRPDVYRHFKNNPEKFAIPGRVKWQQIHLVYGRHGGKRGTKKLAEQLIQRLEDGEEFAALAREFSDGPTAKEGGYWDWTIENSLKSKELDEALFGMPVGEEFARIDGPEAIDIVVVLDRQEAGFKTFASVQTDIRNELKSAEFHRSVKDLLKELADEATIEDYTNQ